jgi:hypothetical protein
MWQGNIWIVRLCSDNYWLHYSVFEQGRGRDFSLQTGFAVRLAYYPMGSELNQQKRDTGNAHPPSAKVKNELHYTSNPP